MQFREIGQVVARHLPGSLIVESTMSKRAAAPRRGRCSTRGCSSRLLSGGREIADPQALLEAAEQVAAGFFFNPEEHVYLDLMLDGRALPALSAVEESYFREQGDSRGPLADCGFEAGHLFEEGVCLQRYGLCAEHARRVARAFVMARLCQTIWPESALPLASVFYDAGRVTMSQPWTPWVIVVLLRLWGLGTLSVTGFRDSISLLGAAPGWLPVTEDCISDEQTREFTGEALRRAVAHLGVLHVASLTDAKLRAFYSNEVRKRPAEGRVDLDLMASAGPT